MAKELGSTEDPRALIPGDPQAIDNNVTAIGERGQAMELVGEGLKEINSGSWTGKAADRFRRHFSYEPAKWQKAGDAFAVTAAAFSAYADALRWAQGQATEAIATWKSADVATKKAHAEHEAAVRAANAENQTRAAQGNAVMVDLPVFVDPGEPGRVTAASALEQARQQLKAVGDETAQVIGKCRDLAPEEPSLLDKISNFLGNLVDGTGETLFDTADTLIGLVPGVMSGHDVGDNWKTLAQGVVNIGLHPQEFATTLIDADTWSTNPGKALGHLLPDLALLAVPGVGEVKAGEKAASTARVMAREVIPEARGAAVAPKSLRCMNDPVSVATGQVVLIQNDVELPGGLPLTISRTHLSSYRVGRSQGPSWASTWDERIEFDGEGFVFFRGDGVVLFYPHPLGTPVLPAEGPRWPLELVEDGYRISDPESGIVRHFTRRYGSILPVTEMTDRIGHRIEFDHDVLGRPEAIRHSGGYHIRAETDNGQIKALYLADEEIEGGEIELVRYAYDEQGNLASVSNSSGKSVNFSYDDHGRLTRWQDRNNHWYAYIYDSQGRCIRNDSSSGFLIGTFRYLTTSTETTDTTGDSSTVDVVPSQEHGTRERITVFTDANEHIHTFYINELDQVVREIDPLGNETRSTWDRFDRLIEQVDPLGRVTKYDYNENGDLVRVVRPDQTQLNFEYNELHLRTAVTEPDGATWQRRYNAAGNLVELYNPLGFRTRYRYNRSGHLSTVENADGQTLRYESNDAGLPLKVFDELGAVTTYKRDSFGRVVEITDPAGGVVSLGWTLEGKPSWRKLPDGATERWTWDNEGNLVEHTDAAGHKTLKEYGVFDVVTAEVRPDGSRTQCAYDPTLRISAVTNPSGGTWSYKYDAAGRLVSEKDFNNRELKYSYNSAGELIEKVNGANEVTTFARDSLGKVRERRFGDKRSHFTYDPVGRLVYAQNPDSELRYEYDVLGQVLTESVNGRAVFSTYDSLGRRTSRTTSSGAKSEWTYDAAGRPEKLLSGDQTLEFSYDHVGREVTRLLGSSAVLSQTWDSNHRLSKQILTSKIASAQQQTLLQKRSFGYRSDGVVARIDDQLAGSVNFDLDPLGQINAAHGTSWTERYAYDANGNVSAAAWPSKDTEAQGSRVYNGGLLENAGNVRYQYDSQGRVTLRQKKRLSRKPDTWHYQWDGEDRLIGVTTPDGNHWRYTYDPLGRRISKAHLSGDGQEILDVTDFTWDGPSIIEQQNSNGRAIVWDYKPNSFQPVLQRERGVDPEDWSQQWFDRAFFAIVTDLVGTPTELVDEQGNLAWRRRTGLWGQPLAGPTGQDFVPLGFPGQIFDAETGFYYNFQRYYDPEVSRYISQDPLRLAAGPNPQAYVPNPVVWVDPLGLMACFPNENIIIEKGKYDYLFGNVNSNSHNTARSLQNEAQLAKIGIHDNPTGRSLIEEHLHSVANSTTNTLRTFSTEFGNFEVKDSLIAGPGGFLHLESTWQVTGSNIRLTTIIPKGN